MSEILSKNHEVYYLNEEELEEQKTLYYVLSEGGMRIYPERILIPSLYEKVADELYNYKFRPTDVLVIGYEKTGTSWAQEIVWSMLNNPNRDNPLAEQELLLRSPVFEFESYATVPNLKADEKFYRRVCETYPNVSFEKNLNWLKAIDSIPHKNRVFKSHLPPSLLNPTLLNSAKVVFTIRDPRDTCLSFYHFAKNVVFFGFKGNIEKFVDAFLSEKLLMGDYANLLKLWMPYRNHKNFHIVFYEDLKLNTMVELKKLNKFFNANLTDEQLEMVKYYTSIEQMKKQDTQFNQRESNLYVKEGVEEPSCFYRKGLVGEHKEAFSEEILKRFKDYIEMNFKDMAMPYE